MAKKPWAVVVISLDSIYKCVTFSRCCRWRTSVPAIGGWKQKKPLFLFHPLLASSRLNRISFICQSAACVLLLAVFAFGRNTRGEGGARTSWRRKIGGGRRTTTTIYLQFRLNSLSHNRVMKSLFPCCCCCSNHIPCSEGRREKNHFSLCQMIIIIK